MIKIQKLLRLLQGSAAVPLCDPSEKVQPGICSLCGYSKKDAWNERPFYYFQYLLKYKYLSLNSMLRNSSVHELRVELSVSCPEIGAGDTCRWTGASF